MELTEFAKNILFSSSLDEKLVDGGPFTDRHPLLIVDLPALPARCEKLSLSRWGAEARVAFPSRSELLNPTQVGVLLHFFANHELLALELMALALLKFPDAPPQFRLGIAHTMRDEQKHLRAYIERMRSLGIEFGDIPLNDFFWSQCASMNSPMDYVCRMSLTFEQANLDFAAYFRDVLDELGDVHTAQLLEMVLQDEMSHVRHGLNWFRRWKPENESDWHAFCSALGAEINPSRAKGMVFRADYRREVGLADSYINALHVFSQSKGRPPRLVYFNPEAEEEIRAGGTTAPVLSAVLSSTRDDLSPVMLFLAAQTDLLVTRRELPVEFLVGLRTAGFLLPEFSVGDVSEKSFVELNQTRKLSGLMPWAISPTSLKFAQRLKLSEQHSMDQKALRDVHSKNTAADLLREYLLVHPDDPRLVTPDETGMCVSNSVQFDEFISRFPADGRQGRFVAKRPWSASGRHRIFGAVADGSWRSQPDDVRRWFEKSWRTGELPLLQSYFSRVVDISLQARIDLDDETARTHILGFTRVLNSERGQYAGSCVGRYLSDADPELLRFFYQPVSQGPHAGKDVEGVMKHLAEWVGARLAGRGFCGPFGIDAFVYRDEGGRLRLFPMIEINPRYTMGRVAVALSRRIIPGRVGVWLHVPKSWLEKLNVASFPELRDKWQAMMPLQIHEKSGGIVIAGGLLETTPAEQCEQVWTCFVVGHSLSAEAEILGIKDLLMLSGSVPTADRPAKLP
ncbi:MAG: hypothetical protein RL189_2430 [Pseudomonadota bacterium]|jgi:uncharacterized ferritin-like protein (DUF455 family)